VISFSERVKIKAEPARVWRALTLPSEVLCWDTGVIEAIDAPVDYPMPGQHVRWRYRLGPLPLTLHDRPSEVEPCARFRSKIRLGPFDFDEIYTLSSQESSGTLLEARLSVASHTPLFGPLLERLVGRPLARSTVRSSLAAIRRHCEQKSDASA
jgi:hypothetical protein